MMANRKKSHEPEQPSAARRAPRQQAQTTNDHKRLVHPDPVLRRAAGVPRAALGPADVLTLQRAFGNRAVTRFLSNAGGAVLQRASENKTGLPDELKAGVESLSGLSLDDVKVHYNSPKPAEVQALAYTQGTDIHIAPGQEKHLPHEAWHVVQQKQGRVKPTLQAKGLAINDDAPLESEADSMGQRALAQRKAISASYSSPAPGLIPFGPASKVIQRVPSMAVTPDASFKVYHADDWEEQGWKKKTMRLTVTQHFKANHLRDDVTDDTAKAAIKSRPKAITLNTIYKEADLVKAGQAMAAGVDYWIKQGKTHDVEVTLTDVPNKLGRWQGVVGRAAANAQELANDANYAADAEAQNSTLTGKLASGGQVELVHV